MTDYVPGALSNFLSGEGNAVAGASKKRKRKKQIGSGNTEAAILFEKYRADSKPIQLPVGKETLQPKSHCFDEIIDPATEVSAQGSSTRQSGMKKRNEKTIMTMEEKARTVFVGNAPLESTRKEIKKLFAKFGAIESVRLRSVIAADQKTSKKVAVLKGDLSNKMKSLTFYVKFKEAKSVEDALSMNGQKLGENMLRVDSCRGHRRYSCQTTVFVGNLPFDVSENELISHFELNGEVSFVRIVRDASTGNSKGFAFVGFKNSATVPLALQLDGSVFKKRQLRVTRVQKKNKVRKKNKKMFGTNSGNVLVRKRKFRSVVEQSGRHTRFANSGNEREREVRKTGRKKKVKNSSVMS